MGAIMRALENKEGSEGHIWGYRWVLMGSDELAVQPAGQQVKKLEKQQYVTSSSSSLRQDDLHAPDRQLWPWLETGSPRGSLE